MSYFTVWLDTEKAKSFIISAEDTPAVTATTVHHHDHAHGHLAQQRDTALMFKELAAHLANAEKILLLGPGQARTQFMHFIEEHNVNVAKKVVGNEAFEHSTDGQIEAYGKKFFQKDL